MAGILDGLNLDYKAIKPKATVGDVAKQTAASAIEGIGYGFQAGGELVAAGVNTLAGTNLKAVNPLQAPVDAIRDTISAGGRVAMRDTPSGDLFKPDTWQMPESGSGYAMTLAQGLGSAASTVLPVAGVLGKGKGAAMAVGALSGGAQAGGAAASDARSEFADQYRGMSDEQLQQTLPAYRELRAAGVEEAVARDRLENRAALYSTGAAGAAGTLSGIAGGALLSRFAGGQGLPALMGGTINNRAGQAAAGLVTGAVGEGTQETVENMSATGARNLAYGRPVTENITDNTFADFAAGALTGGAVSGGMGALSRPQATPDVQPTATPENPLPAPVERPDPNHGALSRAAAQLPAPAEVLALPAPEQSVYVDSNGVAQDIGPVRNVDGVMQPAAQARVPASPDMRGNPGLDRQAPVGERPNTVPAEEQRRIDRLEAVQLEQERADRAAAAFVDKVNMEVSAAIAERRAQNEPEPQYTLPAGLDLADKQGHGRWHADLYRNGVDGLVSQLTKGGDVAYVRDQNDRITGRTASINPKWWQDMDASVKPGSVEQAKAIVQKALKGEKLGPKQARFVATMMDMVDDLRLDPQRAEENRAILAELEWAAGGEAARNQVDSQRGAERLHEVSPQDDAELYAYLDGKVEPFSLNDLTPEDIESIKRELIALDDTTEATRQAGDINDGESNGLDSRAIETGREVPAQQGLPRGERNDPQDGAAVPVDRTEPELLASYSEGELAERERARAEVEQADAATRQQQTQRAQADAERDSFSLTGSNRTADVAAAAGQGDLLGAPGAKAATSLEGQDIDGDWVMFANDSGTLGIPRADMPQIKAEHRGAMVNFLNARGISHAEATVPADSLKPTQAEYSREKVAKAKTFEGGDRSILVSKDGHVLDGHHQWLAKREQGEDVKTIRLNAPIRSLLKTVEEFPSASKDDATAQPESIPEMAMRLQRERKAAAKQAKAELVDSDSELIEQTRANMAGETQERAALIALRDMIEIGTDVMNDGSFPPAINEQALGLSERIDEALDADDIADVQEEAAELVREWLKRGDMQEAQAELEGIQRVIDQQRQAAGNSIASQLASLDEAALSALIDDVANETAAPQTSKPKAKRSTKAKTATGKPRIRKTATQAERTDVGNTAEVSRTAGQIAKSMGVNMSSAGMNALEGLTKLFGGPGRLNSGLSFDEETYAKAKPYFAAAMADVQAAGKDLRDFIRALVGQFGDGVKPYILRYAQDLKEEQGNGGTNNNLEPDSAANAQRGAPADLLDQEPGAGGLGARSVGGRSGRDGADAPPGDAGNRAAAVGERSDSTVDREESAVGAGAAGSSNGGRGRPSSTGGLHAERTHDGAANRAAQTAVTPQRTQVKPSSKPGTVAEIRQQMPFLTEGQAQDVVFAEKRLSKPEGYGVLHTNGTGTGKTFTGLGITARMDANGKSNILVLVPKQPIADAWVKAGRQFFGLDIKQLGSTQDNGGSGIVVTTYANLSANGSLALREWDAVVADEAHYLSSAEDGQVTQALETLRALTKRRGYETTLVYMREADKVADMKRLYEAAKAARVEELNSEADRLEERAKAIRSQLDALVERERAAWKQVAPIDKPRGIFLSATPFAYEKNVQWAQEFLFDWGRNDGSEQSYNSGGSFERFMMQHFGYRMRYNKLTAPDAKVDSGLMQRAFNAWLKREGALSSRALDSQFDYDRLFVTIESPIGRRVDEALKWLWDQSGSDKHESEDLTNAFRDLNDKINKESFNYHARMYFLEAIKAKEAIPHIKAQLAAGRKVLVMHDFKKGGAANPFRLSPGNGMERQAYEMFADAFPDLIRAFDYLPSPITQLSKAFPDALIYNGSVSSKNRIAMQNQFNDDADDAPRVMIAQGDAMREGVSIHDTTGKFPRALVHLGMPVKPTAAIQQEGRIYRTGQASDAMFRYFTIGTSWERHAFASKIAGRAGTAENLAMGEQARGLKQAFISAYENADLYEPGFAGEGKGGKADDQAAAAALTPWDSAKSFYFGTKKQGKGRAARGREGVDYFATPEPVGLKMVEWADIRGGESVLEPSAGHGAIARWFPENSKVRVIEDSAELASRVALHVDGDVVQGRFEDHNIVNKYDAVVMNPPYGFGGSTAIEHLAKAANHLREGGRVVALIPTGPAADKKFENWLYGMDAKGKPLHPDLHMVADVALPNVTFERAGTAVATRIVVIDRAGEELAKGMRPTVRMSLSGADSVAELFDRLENLELPARVKPVEEAAEQTAPAKSVKPKQTFAEKKAAEAGTKYVTDAPIIEHVTGKGKTLRGVIVTDMSVQEVKDKFYPYAFKKDGGVFLREEFVERPESDARMQLRGATRVRRFVDRGTVEQLAIRQMGKDTVARQFRFVSYAELPAPIRDEAARQGAKPEEVRAVHWRSKTYLVDDRFRSETDALQAIFHEHYVHFGLRAKYGSALRMQLGKLLNGVGGLQGVKRLASVQGIDLSLYENGLAMNENIPEHDRALVMMEELLAHMGESTGTLKRMLQEFVGMVRNWLRKAGYKGMAELSVSDLAFELRGARQAAIGAGRTDGGNGPMFRMAPSQALRQTDTEAFKAWFGDSKIVDQQGQPLVVYHGTRGDFDAFDVERAGDTDEGWYGRGVYSTASPDLASAYADEESGSNVLPLYVSLQNPYYWPKGREAAIGLGEAAKLTKELQAQGYDGVIVGNDWGDTELEQRFAEIIVFKPTQVKSASGNAGTFDPTNPDIRFSLGVRDEQLADEALRKLGLKPEAAQTLKDKIAAMTTGDMRNLLRDWGKRTEEGLFDGLNGIKKAEEAVGVTDPNQQGYVSARLATGIADVMHAVMHYGAPEWQGGIIGARPDTRGLLDILGDLGQENLTDWLGWLGGKRAQMLKSQGRENNLTDTEIAELLELGRGKETLFEKVYRDYAKINEAVLDVAQEAGLLTADNRAKWATEYYVPFYRVTEEGLFLAPRGKTGLSHQTAGIKALKGGKVPTNDLLENILTNWTKRLDASLKNKALIEVVDNLKGSDFLTDESIRYTQAIIPRAEIAKRIRKDRKTLAAVSDMLGMPEGSDAIKVAGELLKPENEGFEKLWAATAPTDPDIIRVQRDGRNEYYKVNDVSLLRGLKHIEGTVFNDPVTRIGRAFKRLLTTGVTASPDFILRNFIRDAAHAWVINKDGYTLGVDSIKGLRQAFAEDADYRDLMFAGSSFQGGYVHGSDPEAAAQIIRRALEKKGMGQAARDRHMASLITSPAQMSDLLLQGWQKYRGVGDKIENSQRLATYKAAIAAGKSKRQAAYEAKDLMDYSLRGNFAAAQWFTDVVPFLNARLQGLYKLGRAARGDKSLIAKEVAIKGGYLAAFSLMLAAFNSDDERYKALPEWDKDMHWHLFLGDEHFRIPKPFELGIIFGTIPERMLHAMVGNQTGEQLTGAVARGFFETLSFNPVPQFYQPIREVQANRDFFRDRPIEGMGDEGKLPEARYDDRTSAIGKALGQLTGPTLGLSPKQLDHLVQGYTGTLGGYVLSMSTLIADMGEPGEAPDRRLSDLPVAKVLYSGADPRSTQYHTDFYDMLGEADQIYRTVRSFREEGRMEAAAELMAKEGDKLKHRSALGMARQQFGAIRKRMTAIYRDTNLSGDEKRRQLNDLQERSNQIAERMVKLAKADF